MVYDYFYFHFITIQIILGGITCHIGVFLTYFIMSVESRNESRNRQPKQPAYQQRKQPAYRQSKGPAYRQRKQPSNRQSKGPTKI